MITVKFIDHSGEPTTVTTESGSSLMLAATSNGVAGISADCGGACACATCHVYIDEAWNDSLPEPSSGEADMLAFVEEQRPTSRLACQVTLNESLDGIVVHTPENQ